MKKYVIIIFLLLLCFRIQAQTIYTSKTSSISFFASTPAENIEAVSDKCTSAIDIKSREIIFKVSNSSFQFPNKMMQGHFTENYIESEKYPFSTFKGKITDEVDLSKDGTYNVTVAGTLDLHGVSKDYQTRATLHISNGTINATSAFKVAAADHGIKIPTIVFAKIARIVDVKISAVYQPKSP